MASQEKVLEQLLGDVAGLDNTRIKKILHKCSSVDEFYNQLENWNILFSIQQDEAKTILKVINVTKRAVIDAEHERDLRKFQKLDVDEIDFEQFYTANKEKIESEIQDLSAEKIKKIYAIVFRQYSSKQPLTLAITSQLGPLALKLVSNLAEVVRKYPTISTGLLSTADELYSFIKDVSLNSAIKYNLVGSITIFCLMSAWSIGKNFYYFCKGEITGMEFWKRIGVDIAAYFVSNSITAASGITGAVIGNFFFPGFGAVIGGIIGSLIGIFSSRWTEAKLREYLANIAIDNKEILNITDDQMYKEALDALNVTATTTKEQIIESRKAYLLALHPDKNEDSLDNENTAKLINLEKHFRIIENYRKARGKW